MLCAGHGDESGYFILAYMGLLAGVTYLFLSVIVLKLLSQARNVNLALRLIESFLIACVVSNSFFIEIYAVQVKKYIQEVSIGLKPELISYELVDGNLIKYKINVESSKEISKMQYAIYFTGHERSWQKDFAGGSNWERTPALSENDTYEINIHKGVNVIEGSFLIDENTKFQCYEEKLFDQCMKSNYYALVFDVARGDFIKEIYSISNNRYVKAFTFELDSDVISSNLLSSMTYKRINAPKNAQTHVFRQEDKNGREFVVKYFTNKKLSFDYSTGNEFDTATVSDGEVEVKYQLYPKSELSKSVFLHVVAGTEVKEVGATRRNYLQFYSTAETLNVTYDGAVLDDKNVSIHCVAKNVNKIANCDQIIQNSTFNKAVEELNTVVR